MGRRPRLRARPLSDHGAIVDVGGWVAPGMELVYERGTPAFRGQWPKLEAMLELAPARPRQGDWPHPALALPAAADRHERHDAWGVGGAPAPSGAPAPGDARAVGGAARAVGGAAAATPPVPPGVLHDNSAGRVAALDAAGVGLQLISPGPSIDACLGLPANLAAGVFAAYNRYITAYCRPHPDRLGAVLQLHGSEPAWSAQEVADLRGEPSVRAVTLCLPVRISPEERNFEPLWDALERADLPVLHRPALCARIWTPRRLLAYLRGAGVLERHPALRIAFLPGDVDRDGGPQAPDGASSGELEALAPRLWASDYPLRPALGSELATARRALGPRADDVLVSAPRRLLGGRW